MALKLEPIHSHGEPDLDGDMEIKHDDDAHVDPFNMVYSWTLDIPVSLAARGLFVYLMDWAGNKKKTWHRRKRMAAAVGVSPRTLHKYLHELEDQGLIWFEHRKAEGKPSMCHISGKARVVQRQQVLSLSANKDPMQNLQEVAPVAKSARPPRKDCKTPSQNLQQNKDIRSNHTNKTDEQGTGADAPSADKPRRPSLKTSDPDIYEAREAIKDRYLALNDLSWPEMPRRRREYTDGDAEALARKCAERGDALAAVQATWDEQWSNGAYPNRDYRLLQRTLDKLAAFRRGELTRTPNGRRGPLRMNQGTSAEVERSWSDRLPECGACGWDEGYNPACPTCRALAAAQEREL